jgi:two-component system CheB/CheR fusion protein
MKAGVVDFIEKPLGRDQLGVIIEQALEESRKAIALSCWREDAIRRIADLTTRLRQIMQLVLAGHPSKNIATDLGISPRTVENHRASIMRKTASKSLPLPVGLALAAAGRDEGRQFAERESLLTREQISHASDPDPPSSL